MFSPCAPRARQSVPRLFLAAAIAFLTVTVPLPATLIEYPAPAGLPASPHYRIEVTQGDRTLHPFVHRTVAQWRTNRSEDASWTSFGFEGSVTVTVIRSGHPFTTCRVLPSSRGIRPVVESDRISFTLDRPGQFSVEFDESIDHPLLVFADPPETEIPSPQDPGVLWLGPGIHDLGPSPLMVAAGQTVYLAPGAFVRGRIHGVNAPGARIRGRGILSGEHLPSLDAAGERTAHLVVFDRESEGVTVEGITLVASPHYNLIVRGRGAHVANVKMMGWWFGNDGIGTGPDSLIEDCFLRVNDDAFKLYHSNTTVRRCVVWQMENGAPFQFSWNMNSDNSGFDVRDCDIIRVDHHQDANNRGIFTAIHGGSGNLSNYLFEDIRIENAGFRLVLLTARQTEWARSPVSGTISNVVLHNVSADGPFSRPSIIRSYESTGRFENITFEDLRIGGRLIHDAREGGFEIDPASTSNILFVVTEPEEGGEG